MTELPEVGAGHRHRVAGLAAVRAARARRRSCCCSPGAARTGGATGSASPPSPAAFVVGLLIFFDTLALAPEQRTRELSLFHWFAVGGLHVDFGLRLDPLSLTFVLLITGVGALIHLYSVGYMSHDPGRRRFFGQLNLFVTAMLLLVLGNNFVMLYLGWEGVGLASYLLIGFYQDRPSAATAAKKAFLMNRVGDVGLAIAIFLLWTEPRHAAVHRGVRAGRRARPAGCCSRSRCMLLLGACGKSGQFPLQAWLPDAMEGPTPVSALIHAATMVTAGVYLIARAQPDLRPDRDRPAGRRDHRHDHAADRGDHRLRLRRHQEGAGLLDGQPDRLHVPRRRARPGRLRAGHLPPAHPRLLQGGALPRGRLGDARDERRGRHAPLRRPGPLPADHVRRRSGWATSR